MKTDYLLVVFSTERIPFKPFPMTSEEEVRKLMKSLYPDMINSDTDIFNTI